MLEFIYGLHIAIIPFTKNILLSILLFGELVTYLNYISIIYSPIAHARNKFVLTNTFIKKITDDFVVYFVRFFLHLFYPHILTLLGFLYSECLRVPANKAERNQDGIHGFLKHSVSTTVESFQFSPYFLYIIILIYFIIIYSVYKKQFIYKKLHLKYFLFRSVLRDPNMFLTVLVQRVDYNLQIFIIQSLSWNNVINAAIFKIQKENFEFLSMWNHCLLNSRLFYLFVKEKMVAGS